MLVPTTELPASEAMHRRSPELLRAVSIEEARILVRRCAEPRPAADYVKAAIRRASRALDMPFSRTRELWYGTARRVDANEMVRLRRTARQVELSQAVIAVRLIESRLRQSCSPYAREAAANLSLALRAIECDGAG
jgi:hypothetical protein